MSTACHRDNMHDSRRSPAARILACFDISRDLISQNQLGMEDVFSVCVRLRNACRLAHDALTGAYDEREQCEALANIRLDAENLNAKLDRSQDCEAILAVVGDIGARHYRWDA